jgi:hypothetical protein
VPSLVGEWESQHQVVDGFTHLVTAWAARVMLQSMASKAIGSPASLLVWQSMEDFDSRRCPALPDELPRVACNDPWKDAR